MQLSQQASLTHAQVELEDPIQLRPGSNKEQY